MLIDVVQRAEAAVAEMLALVKSGAATSLDMRFGLERSKAMASMLSAFQAAAAVGIAARDHHGDEGAGILRHAAGLSRRDAESRVQVAGGLDSMPAVRDALETGRVSFANARQLAQAGEKVGVVDVEADPALMAKAEVMPDDQFAREARRWTAQRQADGGEADFARRKARRSVRIWDAEDGLTHLKAELDAVTGARIRNRLEDEARRMYQADKNRSEAESERRTFQQCMADSLDRLIAPPSDGAHADAAAKPRSRGRRGGLHPLADIVVVAHVDDQTSRIVAQLANGEPLPQSVLDELACHSAITPVIYGSKGVPLWRGFTKRSATDAQFQALVSRDGGCSGCGGHPALCQPHHVKAWFRGGRTDITNMTLLCWDCHQKVHYHGWQVVAGGDGRFKVEPPTRVHYGPATAPDRSPTHQTAAIATKQRASAPRSDRAAPGSTAGPASRARPSPPRPQQGLLLPAESCPPLEPSR